MATDYKLGDVVDSRVVLRLVSARDGRAVLEGTVFQIDGVKHSLGLITLSLNYEEGDMATIIVPVSVDKAK